MKRTEIVMRHIRHWTLVVIGYNDNKDAIIYWNPIVYVIMLMLIIVRGLIGFGQGVVEIMDDLIDTRATWRIK